MTQSSPVFMDYAAELVKLESEMRQRQELARLNLILAAAELERMPTWLVLLSGRYRDAMNHILKALMEVKAVNDGVVQGMMDLFKATMNQKTPGVGDA